MLVELAAQGGLAAWVRGVAAAGYSPSMHAIGDEAVRIALDAIDEAEPFAPHLHARIEHAQHVAAPDLKRFRSRIASMQPLHKVDDAMYAARCLAAPQLAGMFAFQSLLEAGVMLAFGSDWPIVSCDPMSGMAAAITGRNGHGEIVAPRQNLRVEQALAAYTGGSARALRMSDAGMLREGFAGDCVVLDRNPFQSDWNDGPPRVLLTISGGEVVYDAR
jgi:predicted amidohydrolase YtcJ